MRGEAAELRRQVTCGRRGAGPSSVPCSVQVLSGQAHLPRGPNRRKPGDQCPSLPIRWRFWGGHQPQETPTTPAPTPGCASSAPRYAQGSALRRWLTESYILTVRCGWVGSAWLSPPSGENRRNGPSQIIDSAGDTVDPLSEKMLAARAHGVRDIRCEEIDAPVPESGGGRGDDGPRR